MQTAESCVLGSEQSSLEQSAPDEKVPELMCILNLHTEVVSSLSAYPVVMPAEQGGDGKGWMGL